ncbi:MAG: sigma-70 family RNA polymerase sigma factor [Bryobacteraceae bacterium]|jgi:RNA polymerase sigma-70 factor (ECF subfamily)
MAASILDLSPARTEEAAESEEDLRLAEALREGADWAYENLLHRFQQPVYALAARLLDNRAEACDVVQEVFLKVFRSIRSFRGQSSLKTWIYRITVNEAHNARRWSFRHRRREVDLDAEPEDARGLSEALPDAGQSPFDVTLNHEQRAIIEAALARLNPIFREAVALRDISDLSYEEIAEVLGVSLGTVKSRIVRGRGALRQQLAGSLPGIGALRWAPSTAE